MGYLDFYNRLDILKEKEYIENFLVYNTSLIIAGLKPAITITLKKNNTRIYENWNKFGKEFLKNIRLNFVELRETEGSIILLIYEEKILKKKLLKSDSMNLFKKLGYPDIFTTDSYVKTLKSRYQSYHCPHELGLFLGIPFEDVKDFMNCTEKKCIMCGYWKVYNDSEKAQCIFNQYDEVKEYTKRKFADGILSKELVLSIKNYVDEKTAII